MSYLHYHQSGSDGRCNAGAEVQGLSHAPEYLRAETISNRAPINGGIAHPAHTALGLVSWP